jgi:hypothetical protein
MNFIIFLFWRHKSDLYHRITLKIAISPMTIATNMAMVSIQLGIKIFRMSSLFDDLRPLRARFQIFTRVEMRDLNIVFFLS